MATNSSAVVAPERTTEITERSERNYKVIVLKDTVNTLKRLTQILLKYLPQMTSTHAWNLAELVHSEGQAIVWVGKRKLAGFYHQQLSQAGLTMAPLEPV